MDRNRECRPTRREMLKAAAGTALAVPLALGAAGAHAENAEGPAAPRWLALMGQSELGARDEVPTVEGTIPMGLRGALYRNGPGLFERGGRRKPHLLDGDGLVQRLSLADGKARYRNAFVATEKFQEEQAAGRYLHSTWSMRKPGGLLANIGGGDTLSQAGVTVYPFGDSIYAFDEIGPVYRLDPATLRTLDSRTFGEESKPFMTKAHTKFDPVTGEWLHVGLAHGRRMTVHALTVGPDGALKSHHVIDSPRQVYFHDFFATESFFVILLHPMMFSPWGFVAGTDSYIESLSWERQNGNLVVVLPRAGGTPQYFEAPAAFMWHALNAYEAGGEIVADFVGYDAPDHFAPHDALFYRIMDGKLGAAREPGKLRRYRIDLRGGRLRDEIVDAGAHEFPMTDPRVATRRHRIGYLAASGLPGLPSGIKRVDVESGRSSRFDFGETSVAGEPVFAARPGGGPDDGWLITQVLDGAAEKSYFAVFDASRIADGPLAKLWLPHHLPISFHGWWRPDGPG